MANEKRRNPRVIIRVLVDFESADTYLYDYSNDLSEGGIFIETQHPFDVGAKLTLRFSLPDIDRIFEAQGIVRWVNEERDGKGRPLPTHPNGMGVEFVDMEDSDRNVIHDYLQRLLNS